MLNSKYSLIFRDVIYLFAEVLIVLSDRVFQEVFTEKYLNCTLVQFLSYTDTFLNQWEQVVTLTFDR